MMKIFHLYFQESNTSLVAIALRLDKGVAFKCGYESIGKALQRCRAFCFKNHENNLLTFIQTAEGRVTKSGSVWTYEYNLKDHLGNVRASFRKSATGTAELLQKDDYYPFGLTFNHPNILGDNKYLYNGKELQQEMGWYDYHARQHDPTLGRFTSVDPLGDSAVSWTTYHYVSNNPINRIDPTGLTDYEINDKGEVVNVIENEESDNIYIVNQDGARIKGQSISFKYGTITAVRNPTIIQKTKLGDTEKTTLTVFEVNGDENATQIFDFFADPNNTSVEWTYASIGKEASNKNIVGTSHQRSSTGVGHYLRATNYTLKEVYHNHPSGVPRPSASDRSGAALYHKANNNTILGIYVHPGTYMMYNQNGAMGALIK